MKHSDLTKKDVAKEGKMPQAAIDALAKKNGKSSKKDSKKEPVKEDLALMAQKAEMDHEVQMARSDLYKAAKYSIKLHELLKNVSEEQGLEGWVAAKITKAADYLSSVKHYMEYEMISSSESAEEVQPAVEQVKESMACNCDENCSCGGNCTPNCDCHPDCNTEDYKESLANKLQSKLKESSKKKTDQSTDESGIMYKAGVKKYGKDGMKKIQSAAGKGASAEEIGAIKDKHNKKKKESFTSLEESVGKAITEEEFDTLAEKQDACYHKVKARYKVWPSAYASGALVQCRKKGAKNWGNKSKK